MSHYTDKVQMRAVQIAFAELYHRYPKETVNRLLPVIITARTPADLAPSADREARDGSPFPPSSRSASPSMVSRISIPKVSQKVQTHSSKCLRDWKRDPVETPFVSQASVLSGYTRMRQGSGQCLDGGLLRV